MAIQTIPEKEQVSVSIYKGEVIIDFFDEAHRYQVSDNGKDVWGTVGVTTVLGVLDKPALVQWSASCAVNRMVEIIDSNKGVVDEVTMEYLKKECAVAWKQKRDNAGTLGTLVHRWIESYIKAKLQLQPMPDKPQNATIQKSVDKFLEWEKKERVEFLESEKIVYSRRANYAGTLDIKYRKKTALGYIYGYADIKTSKYIYDTFPIQMAAYRLADEEEQIYSHGELTEKTELMTVLRVGKDDGAIEVVEFGGYQECASAFLCALFLYRHLKKKQKK